MTYQLEAAERHAAGGPGEAGILGGYALRGGALGATGLGKHSHKSHKSMLRDLQQTR